MSQCVQCLNFEKFITTLLCVLAYLNVYSSIYMYTVCMSILISLVPSLFLAWLPLLALLSTGICYVATNGKKIN